MFMDDSSSGNLVFGIEILKTASGNKKVSSHYFDFW